MPVEDLDWGLEVLADRRAGYQLYRRYYDGDHRLTFATEKFRSAFGSLFQTMADNLAPTVVDAIADRLQVEAFSSEPDVPLVQDIWEGNRMPRRSGEVHLGALREGDAYVIVWPDRAGTVRLWPQDPKAVVVRYDEDDEPDRIIWAAKVWRVHVDGQVRSRANLYYPARIEKYLSRGRDAEKSGQFDPYIPDGETDYIVTNIWDEVPVFHFANNASVGDYGRSELKDVIPLQDGLNKAIADMLVAMEFHAYPQRWVVGLEVDTDPDTGRAVNPPFKPGADRLWTVGDPAAKFGQFDPAGLEGFLRVQDSFRAEIARVTGTPMHYLMLSGEFPSGESMKTAEARLVKKVFDRQVAFGDVWEDAMSLAVRMAGGPAIELTSIWENPETRSDLYEAQTQQIKQDIGVSQDQSLREMGYTPDEIDAMREERGNQQASLGEAMLRSFDRGGVPVE